MSVSHFEDPEMQEIFEGFLIETQELLDSLSQDLMLMENSPDDTELINRIFRSFHTIKGTSSFMGFSTISEITHSAEDLLNKMRRGELRVSLPIVDVLLEVHDWIQLLVDRLNSGDTSPVDYSETLVQLEKLKSPEYEVSQESEEIEDSSEIEEIPDETQLYISEEEEIEDTHLSEEIHVTAENTAIEDHVSAVDMVVSNSELVTKPGDFSDDELALIEAAFAEVNLSLFKETGFKKDDSEIQDVNAVDLDTTQEIVTEDITVDEYSDIPEDELHSEDNDLHDFGDGTQYIGDSDFSDIESIAEVSPLEEGKKASEIEKINKAESAPRTAGQMLQSKTTSSAKPDAAIHESVKDHTQPATAAHAKAKVAQDTIRVDVLRVETLMDLSGELVLGRNRLAQLTEMLEHEFENKEKIRDLIETTSQIDFVTSEIQAAVMRMRMVPIGKLYQKAPRIVRDLSKEFGKQINLHVQGEETEIDRGIIEELNDPLVHMIRNSCDHGIESPEDRIKAGKQAIGTITLDAEQEGNNIVLRISDDGKGMDPEKLKQKAVEKGIISAESVQQMSSRDAFQLIFLPGFSTATVVSNVSGRGVGMDVVRTNILNLKGMIDIESEIGAGTTFIIKLPLTLAIIQGLLVKVKAETYALPLSSVVEVVAIDINNVYSVNQQEVIRIRTEVLPIIRLDNALGVTTSKEKLDDRYVVVVGLGIQRIGLVVDELLGQQEIVIKSLGEYLGTIPGIAGSTILGDGRVIMIIDVAELIQDVYSKKYLKH